jgi:iduronate 2-sulfatase
VFFLDAQLGMVIDALEASVSKDNTVVVFVSDHGFHTGDHGLFGSHTLFESSTRVPLIISPALNDASFPKRGTKTYAPVEVLDVLPTLSELVGIDVLDMRGKKQWEGKSLVPLLKDPKSFVKAGAVGLFDEYMKRNDLFDRNPYHDKFPVTSKVWDVSMTIG